MRSPHQCVPAVSHPPTQRALLVFVAVHPFLAPPGCRDHHGCFGFGILSRRTPGLASPPLPAPAMPGSISVPAPTWPRCTPSSRYRHVCRYRCRPGTLPCTWSVSSTGILWAVTAGRAYASALHPHVTRVYRASSIPTRLSSPVTHKGDGRRQAPLGLLGRHP